MGMRIPKGYFETAGVGESNNQHHAGSFHLALRQAGIEMCNIMTYSSIMPDIAEKVERPELRHGSVMEAIIAREDTEMGKRATAGIIYGWLHDKKTDERFGGLVCEYHGDLIVKDAREHLEACLKELHVNGYEHYELKNKQFLCNSFVPNKKFGTALVAICFTSYLFPMLEDATLKTIKI